MTTAREVMTTGGPCASVNDTAGRAARMMRDLGVSTLPICGEDARLLGVVTARDLVVGCVANELDASSVHVREYAGGDLVTVDPDDDVAEVLHRMTGLRQDRLPVVHGRGLVGMISQADIVERLRRDRAQG